MTTESPRHEPTLVHCNVHPRFQPSCPRCIAQKREADRLAAIPPPAPAPVAKEPEPKAKAEAPKDEE